MLSNTPSAVVDHAWRPQSLRRYQTKSWIWLRSKGRMEKARRRSTLVMHITLVGKNICEPCMPEAPSFPCARNRRDREQHDNVSKSSSVSLLYAKADREGPCHDRHPNYPATTQSSEISHLLARVLYLRSWARFTRERKDIHRDGYHTPDKLFNLDQLRTFDYIHGRRGSSLQVPLLPRKCRYRIC